MKPGAPTRGTMIAAILLITAAYFYFLIFAEFALLELARALAPAAAELRWVMLSLGIGGLLGSGGAALLLRRQKTATLLVAALLACAIVTVGILDAKTLFVLAVYAFLCGTALGALTVTVASVLRHALGPSHLGLGVGAGTGLAYALSNLPWVFHASPTLQALLAATAVGGVVLIVPHLGLSTLQSSNNAANPRPTEHVVRWTIVLLALVWFDSAAFYIIQHTPALHAATWERSSDLWTNATIHLGAACVSGWLLDRGWHRAVAGVAILVLALAGLSLDGFLPAQFAASWFYTAGVSFYSVALLEVPARTARPGVAAVMFGIAGWIGSALGIGMAQDLARIPPWFILVSVAGVALALVWHRRLPLRHAILLTLLIGFVRADEIQTGREVYIAEGCIHCHSQYVRSQVPSEVLNWGPATSLEEALAGEPPLFGTRRQGPDLSRVGNRRSREWNRIHLLDPQALSPGSRMPKYAHLFAAGNDRGNALVEYLASLGASTHEERQRQIESWTPSTIAAIPPEAAATLFGRLCSQCHGPAGRGDGSLVALLNLKPPNWTTDPWRHVGNDETERTLCRIVKFGLPGAAMAGHEYLPDAEIVGLARYVRTLHKPDRCSR